MRALRVLFLLLFLSLGTALSVTAIGLPWKDHQPPFDFVFGNHIDSHQQLQILPDGSLFGYLYISFTGETDENGIPFAQHKDCNKEMTRCSVGWEVHGVPGQATFISHPVGDHPIWEVKRANIPAPGAYTHFHWLGWPEHAHDLLTTGDLVDGYFLQLTAKDTFIFKHGNEQILVENGVDNATHINIVSGLTENIGGF